MKSVTAMVHRRALLRHFVATLAAVTGCADSRATPPRNRDDRLRFGLFTARDKEKMLADWKPFMTLLSTAIGREVEAFAATEGEIVAAFKDGAVDLAWLGNVPALDLVESGVGAVFAQVVTKDGESGYSSIMAAGSASPLQSLDDVIERAPKLRLAIGEKKSVSGYLVPLYYAFAKRRINDPTKVFRAVASGSSRQNLVSVSRGEADVGISNTEEIRFLAVTQPDVVKKLKVIWTSPEIPQSPLVWSTRLPPDLRRKVQDFCTAFGTKGPDQAAALRMINLSGFKRSKNQQLVPIADIQMFLEWQRVNNLAGVSPEERQRHVEAIAKRGSKLELLLKIGSGTT